MDFIPHHEIASTRQEYDAALNQLRIDLGIKGLGQDLRKHSDFKYKTFYKFDYEAIFTDMANGVLPERETFRMLILEDLFFIVHFVMGIEKANHPFVVDRCHDVETGPKTNTLDVWARFHYKSVIITQAEKLQYHLRNPEHCTGIMAYARPLGKGFLRSIKVLCEESALLKWCFPDVLWQNPQGEAPKWSEDDGLIFKRKSASRKESTIEAWGLVEGQPTGRHFERCVFDDIETDDIKDSPDMLEKVFSKFQMAGNLGTGSDSDIVRVIGTYYSNFGPIRRIEEMVFPDDDRVVYETRKVPGSDDGTRDGKPVLMGLDTWGKLKLSEHFNSQQLCDPTPSSDVKLNHTYLRPIESEFIPRDVYKFMVLDQAGGSDTNKGKGDLWACGTFGVRPKADEIGASDVYIMDLEADQMTHSEGIETVVRMYLDAGMVRQLGVEKVGLSTTEVHIVNALRAHGRRLSEENKNLVLLRPGGRSLAKRIEGAVQWPLNNGKIYYSTAIPKKHIDRMKMEMEKFPFFHSDIVNIIAYLYDMLKEYRFPLKNEKRTVDFKKVFLR